MDLLRSYADKTDDDDDTPEEPFKEPENTSASPSSPDTSSDSTPHMCLADKTSAPHVDDTALALTTAVSDRIIHRPLDPSQHAVSFNPTYNQLWAPIYGPSHPYVKDGIAQGMRNHKLGFVEDASIHSFLSDEQYNTFHKYGYAADPSGLSYVGDLETLERNEAGRSGARALKKSSKISEPPVGALKVVHKRPAKRDDLQTLKKKKLKGVVTSINNASSSSSPVMPHIPEDVLNHQCIGRHKADDLYLRQRDLLAEFTKSLDEWNIEFMMIKYLQKEYKRMYDQKTKETNALRGELIECRTKLVNIIHSLSLQNQQVDRLQVDLEEAQATIAQLRKDQRALVEKVTILEAENKRSQTLIAEKETALFSLESSKVIEDFKKSIAFKTIIQDHVQESRYHIYEVEVKALEQECIDEGFIRGFLKGVRLVQRRAGVTVDGLTPSQASSDSPSDSDADEVESELQEPSP